MPVRQNKTATASKKFNSLPRGGGYRATADAWEEKNTECRSDQIHCGGGVRSGSRGVREIDAAYPDGSQWAVTRR